MGGRWPNSHPGKYIQKMAKSGPERRWMEPHLKECVRSSQSVLFGEPQQCASLQFTPQKDLKAQRVIFAVIYSSLGMYGNNVTKDRL